MEKLPFDGTLLIDQLLFPSDDLGNQSQKQDMGDSESPSQEEISSPRRRTCRRMNFNERPTRRRRRNQEEPKEMNHGHWLLQENKRYHWFLQIHYQHFVNSHMRRTDKIFKTMELFIGSRQAEQCRSHHQKMEKKYINFTNILIHFREEYYNTVNPTLMMEELQQLQIQCPDGLANQEELAAYRQMQEQARKKFGRKRMWRRSISDKQPTPVTRPPEPLAESALSPAVMQQEQRQSYRNEINMFDQINNNIGDISIFNEKDDISCLFHSFLNP